VGNRRGPPAKVLDLLGFAPISAGDGLNLSRHGGTGEIRSTVESQRSPGSLLRPELLPVDDNEASESEIEAAEASIL